MENELQVEAGNYTRIVNRVIEELVKTPLLGAELAVCLFIIRKTYGFNKTQDAISLTQFEKGTNRSRPTIVKALKNLQLVNILLLVKQGGVKNDGSVWAFNKYYDTWKVVKTPLLVKDRTKPSKEKLLNLVKTPKHTKDNYKRQTKDIATVAEATGNVVNEFIGLFKEINPSFEVLYSNRTQRASAERMLKKHGIDSMRHTLEIVAKTNAMQYAPVITTPLELERSGGKLKAFLDRKKDEKIKNKIVVV